MPERLGSDGILRTLDDFEFARHAQATKRVYDVDGSFAPRGSVGDICDRIDVDGYLVVNFPETGPILCKPMEVRPA